MIIREIFHINTLFHQIKLDSSENEDQEITGEKNSNEFKVAVENVFGNEWNQEYELIYLAYILER